MKNLEKMAFKDAETWASAEMAYGEGAGTRRKLVNAEIESKSLNIPGYYDAFEKAYKSLDMNKYAKAAIRERKALDRAAKTSKNFNAVRTGKLHNLSTGVFLAVGAIWLAHETGYDKKIEVEMRKAWARLKEEIQTRKEGRRIRNLREATINVIKIDDDTDESKE